MTDEELRAIRERCDAATPGPWTWCSVTPKPDGTFGVCGLQGRGPMVMPQWHGESVLTGADFAFIAAARSDVPHLVEEIERLRTWIETYRKWSLDYYGTLLAPTAAEPKEGRYVS